MSTTLLCLGFGYCAAHYAAVFGARFTCIVGTTRDRSRIPALGANRVSDSDHSGESGHPAATAPDPQEPEPRVVDERTSGPFAGTVDMLSFDGRSAGPDLRAAVAAADALLISAAPDAAGDPVLAVLTDALAAAPRLASIVYLSTVGVYGDHGGAWIDESAPTRPVGARGRERIDAENAWRALATRRGTPLAILRLAGIYGPGQNALVNLRTGRARRIVKPGQMFNRIHVTDIAQAIDAAFAHRADGTFNVADDEPSAPGDPIAFAAGLLGAAPPPEIPFAEARKTMTAMAVSFYGESKRVRNDRLKRELGVRLRYPTYREGLAALHAEMLRAETRTP